MLKIPMAAVVKSLPLREDIRQALLGERNAERAVLDWLMHYELGEWKQCDRIALEAGLCETTLPEMYAEALLWAETNLRLTR